MGYLPPLQQITQQPMITTDFLGYNHREIINDGEMYDMKNLTGDKYPLLTQRKKRGMTSLDVEGQESQPMTGIHGRDQLVFIRGTDVYWAMQPVSGLSVSTDAAMLPKKIVSMGAYVCIFPDKVYFNTADLTDRGSMERLWTLSGSNIAANMCRKDGTDYDMTEITISSTPPENPTHNQMWIDQSGDVDVLKQYSTITQEWTQVATTYIKLTAAGIGTGLKQDDVVHISGLTTVTGVSDKIRKQIEALNVDNIIYQSGTNYIVVAGLLSASQAALKDQTVHADVTIPDMDYIIESQNRLWGCKYGLVGGQVVNEIHASKLGDFRQWNNYLGLSTDSYTVSVGTDGPFTGAVTQRGYPVFFKENCIHRISGSTPSSYQMTTTMARGVQLGSWASAVVVNEAIFYKSRTDIMMFDGSMPVSVSSALGEILYSDATAGTWNGKYYISMKDPENQWHMFVLNTENGLWHHEDNFHALGFGTVGDEIYAIDASNNLLVTLFGSMGEAEADNMEWSATFGLFGTDYIDHKYLTRFNLRMSLPVGSYVHLWIEYDSDGVWHDEGEIRGHSLKTFMVPVLPRRCDHLRFRVDGIGPCTIYSIGRVLEVGSDG